MIEKRALLLQEHHLTERQQKNFQLLERIRKRGPLTRTELSQATGFNIVTVSNYVNQFMNAGIVSERGYDVSTGGRKPILVELNASMGFAVGIDLGPMNIVQSFMTGVITNLKGEIQHRIRKPRASMNMDALLQETGALIHELLEGSSVDPKKIQGIGVGMPGILDERAGTIRDTARGGIRANYASMREVLEAQFKVPVFMGNDAALAGYGELRLGLDRTVENLVYLYSDVGASLIFNGHIYWGSGGSAGELGIFVPSDDDYLAWIKSPSFVLQNTWDLGLGRQVKKLIEEGNKTTVQELVEGKLDDISVDTVIQAAQGDDQLAKELMEHTAMQLGIRIAYLVNLLNPEVVIIGGGIEKAGALLLEPVWRSVKKYAYEEPASLVDVLPAQLGDNGVALGAACWVVREVFIQT